MCGGNQGSRQFRKGINVKDRVSKKIVSHFLKLFYLIRVNYKLFLNRTMSLKKKTVFIFHMTFRPYN